MNAFQGSRSPLVIAERLPERHLGDEKPPVKSNFVFQHLAWFVFQHLAWCIDVWISTAVGIQSVS